ncbi:glucose/mannose transport system permease protein [Halarchaeum rubridurum]|uniref:Glucose/mannose transport system permease protein n=1 Tax=Halarchaeum rubridurum TaxID=489911 RepID=A0A830G367_9EURY|nr:carbohydrate ABC transporter permease [Halarchaeum rubridurum]MBP1955604.1 glucose/mannose transport system permease protein [Halarchaeum rubridurum]GGM73679.1 sugar ABC transporter permease [Halarchaeum rubridurum]
MTETNALSGRSWRSTALYAVLVLLVVFYLLPLWTGLVTSIKADVLATAPFLPPAPAGFTSVHWTRAVNALAGGLVNSLILAIPATILSALLGSMAAYGLTTLDWRYQVPILMLFIAGIFIPYQAVLIPLSKFWASVVPVSDLVGYVGLAGWVGDLVGLILSHVAYGIPICTLLFRTYYKDFNEEMIEAARLDGATTHTIYRRIILPLSVPMFAVTLIYQFTQVWNDLLFALVLVGPGAGAPVTVPLSQLGASLSEVGFGIRMAGAFVAALPTIIVYVLFGDQFAEGVST